MCFSAPYVLAARLVVDRLVVAHWFGLKTRKAHAPRLRHWFPSKILSISLFYQFGGGEVDILPTIYLLCGQGDGRNGGRFAY